MDVFIIQMTRDIDNPTKDRRSRDWNKQQTIKAGLRFIVEDDTLRAGSDGCSYGFEHRLSELGKLIEANAERVEPKGPWKMAAVAGHRGSGFVGMDYPYILEVMLKLGRISLDDFKAVADYEDAEEAEEDANDENEPG